MAAPILSLHLLLVPLLLLLLVKAASQQVGASSKSFDQSAFARKFTILGNSTTLPSNANIKSTYMLINAGASTASNQESANQQVKHQQQQQQQQRAGLLEKICIGTSNKLARPDNKSDYYQNLVDRYNNCTYVIGNLEITYLDNSSAGPGRQLDLSFLESIREITGYLLVAHVDVDQVRMPNLQIIRGRDLFKLHEEDFALILIKNELRSLQLPNLSEILTGSVGSYNNTNLCHIRTIEWEEILGPTFKSIFVFNGTEPECPACELACSGHCWAATNDMCQKFSKMSCAPACGGRCFGPTASECCHEFCAGGCLGPSQTDCLACKNFYDAGACVQECPSLMRYNPSKFLWEQNPHGKFAFGATCVKECPENMLRDSGACVRVCPANKRSQMGECVPCAGPCPKNCQGVEVVHSGNIDQLINCTEIEGSLTILDESFTGGGGGGGASDQSVANSTRKPMHPSRLEVFKTLREITGYLNIKAKHPDFTDLSYFSNLKTIGGRQTTDMFHALSITRTSLQSLNLRSLRKVRTGKITIEDNSELCYADTIQWDQLGLANNNVIIRNNAEKARCSELKLQCHKECAQDGCWGPGPDECLSCENYKLDEYCVVDCKSTDKLLGSLSYQDPGQTRGCKRCHQECRAGCVGTEARHCLACKSVKDGPYCVPDCPSHKYNNNGTCDECDKACGPDGCSGPSGRLGAGGCNSCAKAVIRSHDPLLTNHFDIHCIRTEDPCPDGFYQEYVVGSSQPDGSPLKSSSGRPVCRKCHHRCKRCMGMGTHKSVCECAKYVAGEQCEDYCPRDYYADEQSRQCVKCSPECNGCFGPTEADCVSCKVYRIYYNSSNTSGQMQQGSSSSSNSNSNSNSNSSSNSNSNNKVRFNCTAQCPADKPHRISESNMLDPYCSEDPNILDAELVARNVSPLGSTWTMVLVIMMSSAGIMLAYAILQCHIEKDKTVKLTMHLSGIDDVEPLTPSNLKPNLAPLRSIKETELRKGKVLGSGFGGVVYEGFWYPEEQENGTNNARSKSRPVAIKVLRDNGQTNMNKEFLDEAFIMASVNHPNLVRLLAVCMTPNHLMLVTQLMPLGCLLDYVKRNKHDIGAKNLLEWGKQIARGMAYLEERRMVHRDLALRNVLLQTPGRALISDFGLAKFLEVDQSEYHSGGGRLPIKWLAPECFRERKFTHKSDVWAFGVTIWELVTFGARPFEEYETRDVPLAIEEGARLRQPSHVTAEVYKVMYACWFYIPDDRPNFKQLAQHFVQFARDPERYLICGAKGIEALECRSVEEYDENNSAESADDEHDEHELSADEAPEVSPTSLGSSATSQPPLGAAMPDLTPTTHNRINEMFRFQASSARRHRRRRSSESSDLTANAAGFASSLTTPILKKLGGMFGEQPTRDQQHNPTGEHLFTNGRTTGAHLKHQPHQHQHHRVSQHLVDQVHNKAISSTLIATDANNNSTFANHVNQPAACWSMHHTLSSNSLGQRSEQPTDIYDYLLPSPPCTNDHGHAFNQFYPHPYDNTDGLSVIRNPPHSAGLVSNITNEEYFLTRYVNDQDHHHSRLSTSNGDIPQSLV